MLFVIHSHYSWNVASLNSQSKTAEGVHLLFSSLAAASFFFETFENGTALGKAFTEAVFVFLYVNVDICESKFASILFPINWIIDFVLWVTINILTSLKSSHWVMSLLLLQNFCNSGSMDFVLFVKFFIILLFCSIAVFKFMLLESNDSIKRFKLLYDCIIIVKHFPHNVKKTAN